MVVERRVAGRPDGGIEQWEAIGISSSLETRADRLLDGIVHRAAILFNVPIGFAVLRDGDRQAVRASIGLGLPLTLEDLATCAEGVADGGPAFLLDPQAAARFAGNKVVQATPGIRFYAAAPVLGRGRVALGALCVMDRRARTRVTAEELASLAELATEAATAFAAATESRVEMKPERGW